MDMISVISATNHIVLKVFAMYSAHTIKKGIIYYYAISVSDTSVC